MAPKKSFGEGSKKRHKSRAQEDKPTAMDAPIFNAIVQMIGCNFKSMTL